MAHELSIQNGRVEMFSGRNMTPWHKLGTVVEGLKTATEALNLAHLDWNVIPIPVQCNGQTLPFPSLDSSGELDRRDCFQGICRQDNGKCLGIVKGRYEPIQNREAFSFFDSLIGQGKAVYDTAGALRDGKQVWLLAKIDGEIEINGDAHRQFALMVTSHDASYTLQTSYVVERVVCANTLSIALSGATQTVKIKHTKEWKNKEEEARRVLGLGEKYFTTIQEALSGMNEKLLTRGQMSEFTRLITAGQRDGESPLDWVTRVRAEKADDISTRTTNIRGEIDSLFNHNGNLGKSRWDALNAVTDYVDHNSTVRGGNGRLENALFGSGARLKQTAFNTLQNEDIMQILLDRPFKPSEKSLVTTSDFHRLMGN